MTWFTWIASFSSVHHKIHDFININKNKRHKRNRDSRKRSEARKVVRSYDDGYGNRQRKERNRGGEGDRSWEEEMIVWSEA